MLEYQFCEECKKQEEESISKCNVYLKLDKPLSLEEHPLFGRKIGYIADFNIPMSKNLSGNEISRSILKLSIMHNNLIPLIGSNSNLKRIYFVLDESNFWYISNEIYTYVQTFGVFGIEAMEQSSYEDCEKIMYNINSTL